MIDTVKKLLRMNRQAGAGLDIFCDLLIKSASEGSIRAVESDKLARFAEQAFTHLMAKPYRGHSIRIRSTDVLADKPSQLEAASVIEVLDDDMPYLVESVIAEIDRAGLTPLLVFHPIYKVARYGSGRLTEVSGPGDRNWAAGDQESYIAVVVDAIDDARAREVTSALDQVLTDVRNAAGDRDKMRARLKQAVADLGRLPMALDGPQIGATPTDAREAIEFLAWLEAGNFTLLGLRDYDFVGHEQSADLYPTTGGALGVLRQPEAKVIGRTDKDAGLTPEIRAFYNRAEPVFVAKADTISRVRQQVPLDYVGVKRYSAAGKLVGELRVVGLFTSAAYLQPVAAIPLVRQKVQRVLAAAGFPPDSHDGRTLLSVLEDLPRDEMFHIDAETLLAWALAIVDLRLRPRPRVLMRTEQFGRYMTVLTFVPRDYYSTTNRERIGAFLSRQLGGRVSAFFPYYTAGPLIRTRFIITLEKGVPRQIDEALIEQDIVELLRTWDERLGRAIASSFPRERQELLCKAYRSAFSAGYEETFDVARAVEDIQRIDRLAPDRPVAIDFYREPVAPEHAVRCAVYRFDAPIPLSERVPVLENFGFRVIDERSYRVHPQLSGARRDVVLHDMVLETADRKSIDIAHHEIRLEDAFLAVTNGLAESDPFNKLVVAAGLHWQEVAIFRAYAAYMRQIRAPFGAAYIAHTLVRHPAVAVDLFETFRARFDLQCAAAPDAASVAQALHGRIEDALRSVASLDEDRILRRLRNLVEATVRTTFYRPGDGVGSGSPIAFKIDSRAVDDLPQPRPYREIFVYAPRVEGIHLRFAPIARGGIRWSDRAQDFRTEVLGLAKAQQVKNTVIVASGAKGGFVPKRLPLDAPREAVLEEGVACYRQFISALLSLTDDLQGTDVVHPQGVVRHDGDDPYLVVAADKGTATFSDFANEIATAHSFWLGDAFASGGSSGYDHKRIGITARGAWECVRRHFRELGLDIQVQPFRVIGVGDMSGDVFGNAMLLSPATLLVAAFDHRDIFIDPAPDAAVSLAERRRLFELPRSSWADYDRTRISTGGGVFSRAAKSIDVTPQMATLLGIEAGSATPGEIIRAILRADADLLWFGGIGTFVRAASESDEQVGDRGNDDIRIQAGELRVRVIGEGANLGITQRGRIEAAERGVRLNTDFIDNSAGVNTSDQEVNIKIALAGAMQSGRLARSQRDALLAQMQDGVAATVLSNNYQQSLALSLAHRTSVRDMEHLARLARLLEERGLTERRLEALPTGAEFAQRAAEGRGLTRPELSVLLSWAKIALDLELRAGPVPDDPANEGLLFEYFPVLLRDEYRAEIAAHRLRREIIATRITNSMINRGGPAFVVRLEATTGSSPADIAYAFMATRAIFELPRRWSQIDGLDNRIAADLQLDLYQRLQDLLIGQTTQLLRQRGDRSFAGMVADHAPAAAALLAEAATIPGPAGRRRMTGEIASLEAAGLPADIAANIAALPILERTLSFCERARRLGSSPVGAARVTYAASEYLNAAELAAAAAQLKPADEYEAEAIATAMDTIRTEADALGDTVLSRGAADADIATWVAGNAPQLAAAKNRLERILAAGDPTIARLVVAGDVLRGTAPRS